MLQNKIFLSYLIKARGEAESEQKARHDTNLKLKAAQSEIEALNEQLEEEAVAKVGFLFSIRGLPIF